LRVCAFIALLGCGLHAEVWASAYNDPFMDLKNNQSASLEQYRGKTLLLSLFEPDCGWCYRQMKTLNRISRECHSHLQPISIGINGSAQRLRRELRKAKVSYPALAASQKWLAKLDGVAATPWTLVVDTEGQIVTTLRGYKPYEELQKLFPSLCA